MKVMMLKKMSEATENMNPPSEEALEWARKCPVTMDCEVELRPLFSPEMFDPR